MKIIWNLTKITIKHALNIISLKKRIKFTYIIWEFVDKFVIEVNWYYLGIGLRGNIDFTITFYKKDLKEFEICIKDPSSLFIIKTNDMMEDIYFIPIDILRELEL